MSARKLNRLPSSLRGIDAGINFIDTAEAYRTEEIVGAAVAQRDRSQIIISTKKRLRGENITREELRAGLHDSLRRLRTDFIDVYHLHGLKPDQYDYYLNEIAPAIRDLQPEGKIRFLGVTENWSGDLEHQMLARAIQDGVWDVILVGFNLLNQKARESVLRPAIEHNIGVLIMFAIRRALSQPAKLQSTLEQLIESGEIDANEIDVDNHLAFLSRAAPPPASPMPPTASPATNRARMSSCPAPAIRSTSTPTWPHSPRPPLPPEITARLKHIFRNTRSVTGG